MTVATKTRVELNDPWIWAPCGVLAIATEVFALRTGRSPATHVYQWLWENPVTRAALVAWLAVTIPHLHRLGRNRWDRWDIYRVLAKVAVYGKSVDVVVRST